MVGFPSLTTIIGLSLANVENLALKLPKTLRVGLEKEMPTCMYVGRADANRKISW